MRYNRIGMTLAILVVVFALGGCMNVQDLTEKEANMLAEYSAGVLLHHSEEYDRRLVKNAQPVQTADPTVPPAAATPAPSPEADSNPADTPGTQDGQTGPEETVDTSNQVSLNDLYHIKGVDISYKSYQFCDTYPPKRDDIVKLTAGEDETLLVVRFQIRNKSGTRKKINLGERAKNIFYILNADGNEYQPDITMLGNTGLNYLNTTIKKGGSEEAVLVYTMAKERSQASEISLKIREGDNVADIQLK